MTVALAVFVVVREKFVSEGLFAVVAVVIIFNFAGAAFGAAGKIAVFSTLGAVGLVATLSHERRRSRFIDALASMTPEVRHEVLIHLENDPLRAEAVHDLGIVPPPVPLRRPVELFPHRANHVRTVRWTVNLWLVVGGLLTVGALVDWLLGPAVLPVTFHSPAEIYGLALMWPVGTVVSWWLLAQSRSTLRVSEQGLELTCPGRRTRRMAWTEVMSARFDGLPRHLRLTSATERIVVGDSFQEYGRLLNIIVSRIPSNARTRVEG